MSAVLAMVTQAATAVASVQPMVQVVAPTPTSPHATDGRQQSVAFLLRAAEAAFTVLQAADPDPVAEAERMAIQDDAGPKFQTETCCFPCGALVPDGRRKWSNVRGWCCAACFRSAT